MDRDDTSEVDGHRARRTRRAAASSASGLASRVVASGTGLVLVPILLDALGPEAFGVWLTLAALLPWRSSVDIDLGLTNGLINRLAASSSPDQARATITAASATLVGMALLVLSAGGALVSITDLGSLLGVTGGTVQAQLQGALLAFGVLWAANLVLQVGHRTNRGLQEEYRSHGWIAAGNLGTVAAVLAIPGSAKTTLPVAVLAVMGPPVLSSLGNAASLFLRRRPDLRPRLAEVRSEEVTSLLRDGRWFLLFGVGNWMVLLAPTLLVSTQLGAAAVPELGVPLRLFVMVQVLTTLVLRPLWPAYVDAASRKDLSWIRATFRRSMGATAVVGSCASLALALGGPALCRLWVGDAVTPAPATFWLLAAYTLARVLGSACQFLLIGMGELHVHSSLRVVQGIATTALSLALIGTWKVPGVAAALLVGEVSLRLVPLAARASTRIRNGASEPEYPGAPP